MYRSLYQKTPLATLVERITQQPVSPLLSSFYINDGLIYAKVKNEDIPRSHDCLSHYKEVISEKLSDWLLGLRLLQDVPLAYLVPDPALLPPESIRFFHVDQTWTDRLVEGALSAANIGTADLGYSTLMHCGIRFHLDDRLKERCGENYQWTPGKDPMTGMLIRSELVRRWPEMLINAFSVAGDPATGNIPIPIPILRKDLISQNIMIVLFAGNPNQVEIREPSCGTRFGIDVGNSVNVRNYKGESIHISLVPHSIKIKFDEHYRTLGIGDLIKEIKNLESNFLGAPLNLWKGEEDNRSEPGGRDVAIHLSQPPYVQVFTDSCPEETGALSSKINLGVTGHEPTRIPLRNGRFSEIHIDADMLKGVSQ